MSSSLSTFAREFLQMSRSASIDLLVVMNGVSAIRRVLPALLADLYVGPLNVVTPAALVCAILLYCWIAIDSIAGLYCWAVIYGMRPICFSRTFSD